MQPIPDKAQAGTGPSVPEATELERRVLAHERILQSLIAFMSRAEPRFLDHLRETFVAPMENARREHDFSETDDYADEFIRAVTALDEERKLRNQSKTAGPHPKLDATDATTSAGNPGFRADRVLTEERNGVWSVTVDGVFQGDFLQREHAEAAAAQVRPGSG